MPARRGIHLIFCKLCHILNFYANSSNFPLLVCLSLRLEHNLTYEHKLKKTDMKWHKIPSVNTVYHVCKKLKDVLFNDDLLSSKGDMLGSGNTRTSLQALWHSWWDCWVRYRLSFLQSNWLGIGLRIYLQCLKWDNTCFRPLSLWHWFDRFIIYGG